MRIRSTKPEFWSDQSIAALDWAVIYDGPIPRRVNEVAPMCSTAEYVYLLFSGTGDLIYVGRSFRPADRFTKHKRKPWWPNVTDTVIVKISEEPRHRRAPWQTYGPNTAQFEALAILHHNPPANVAAPSRMVMP